MRPAGTVAPVQTDRTLAWLRVAVVVAVAFVAGWASACSSTSTFDREKAVTDVMAQGGGGITRAQAECYVDRVVKEVGTGALTPGTSPPPEQIPRLTGIRIDCIGVASLGTSSSTTSTVSSVGTQPGGAPEPQGPGDDPHLDALYQACAAGSGAACDELFDAAPLGSAYEEFASTCGGRTKELRCGDVYPGTSAPTTSR